MARKPIYLLVDGQKIWLIAMLNKLMSLGSIFFWRKTDISFGCLGGWAWVPCEIYIRVLEIICNVVFLHETLRSLTVWNGQTDN